MRSVLLLVLAAAIPGSVAAGQTVEARIAFRDDHAPNTSPTGSEFEISQPGTYNFQVLFGLFDAEGFTNRGMFNFVGRLSLSDPGAGTAMAPRVGGGRRYPYSYHLGLDGQPGQTINFDSNRGFGSIEIPWAHGEPMPTLEAYPAFDPAVIGSGGAPDEFFPGYRFTVTVTDMQARTIEVTASGLLQAISVFTPYQITPPEEGPGSVVYFPTSFVTDPSTSSVLRLNIVPGPAVLWAAAGGLALRRRRGR